MPPLILFLRDGRNQYRWGVCVCGCVPCPESPPLPRACGVNASPCFWLQDAPRRGAGLSSRASAPNLTSSALLVLPPLSTQSFPFSFHPSSLHSSLSLSLGSVYLTSSYL